MPVIARHERILAQLETQGFASVSSLSGLLRVSEVTVRRDLEQLETAGRLRRTHGGALSLRPLPGPAPEEEDPAPVDVLIATPAHGAFDRALLDRAAHDHTPVVAESVALPGARTLVAPDNTAAGAALGRWAGEYARSHALLPIRLLDLTYDLPNTRLRSEGFLAGLCEVQPDAEVVLSISASSTHDTAYQITHDVLAVHPEINMIFAINDATASGASDALSDEGVDPARTALYTYGLEGNTLRRALLDCGYCRAALAMFPEIVGPTAVEAAILAFQNRPLPPQLVTPHTVISRDNLADYYMETTGGWRLNWPFVLQHLALPLPIDPASRAGRSTGGSLPRRIGFVVPFSEHEWYRNLGDCMREHAERYGIALAVIDAEESRQEDLTMRQRRIAQTAAGLVQAGDVVLIDAGPITTLLAEELAGQQDITVITNSLPAIEALRDRPGITLIAVGGLLRQGREAFHGPTAELAIRELRGDKLFLSAAGVTPGFGISHDNLAEVGTKQAMIRVAREIILLADHSRFGQESVAQVAPLRAITRVITDNALPSTTRLELSKTGIEVIIART